MLWLKFPRHDKCSGAVVDFVQACSLVAGSRPSTVELQQSVARVSWRPESSLAVQRSARTVTLMYTHTHTVIFTATHIVMYTHTDTPSYTQPHTSSYTHTHTLSYTWHVKQLAVAELHQQSGGAL